MRRENIDKITIGDKIVPVLETIDNEPLPQLNAALIEQPDYGMVEIVNGNILHYSSTGNRSGAPVTFINLWIPQRTRKVRYLFTIRCDSDAFEKSRMALYIGSSLPVRGSSIISPVNAELLAFSQDITNSANQGLQPHDLQNWYIVYKDKPYFICTQFSSSTVNVASYMGRINGLTSGGNGGYLQTLFWRASNGPVYSAKWSDKISNWGTLESEWYTENVMVGVM